MRAKRPDARRSPTSTSSAWTEGYATQQILEKAAANGDMTRAGVVAAAKDRSLEIDLKGLVAQPDVRRRAERLHRA